MKALVLAGGFPQIALLKELKSRGCSTVLADYYENPVAKPYADKHVQVSTLDVEAIADTAKKEQVDFLITACTDQALLTVAQVSEMLGKPCYIDYRTALNVTNKAYMKKVFEENGIPTAKHVIMDEFDASKLTSFRYPLIVKPVDCNSSKGVKRADNEAALKEAFDNAVKLSRTKTAIVEEFISGPEISVDAYVEGGKAHVLCASNNDKIADSDGFIIFRGRCPAKEAKPVQEKIESAAQQIADAFGLMDTPMLIQLITDGRNIYILEFSARTGGGTKYIRIKRTTGFDVIAALVDLSLGKKPHVPKYPPYKKFYADEFIYCKFGYFDHLDGFEELKQSGVILDYYLFKGKGSRFNLVKNSGDRIAGFTIEADTPEKLAEKHNTVAQSVRVIGTDGEDMMRHDLLTDIV